MSLKQKNLDLCGRSAGYSGQHVKYKVSKCKPAGQWPEAKDCLKWKHEGKSWKGYDRPSCKILGAKTGRKLRCKQTGPSKNNITQCCLGQLNTIADCGDWCPAMPSRNSGDVPLRAAPALPFSM